jgi:hydrogenase maturation protease
LVGLGNALAGDDAYGLHVLDRLRSEEAELREGTTLLKAHDDLLGCIDQFNSYDQVILIDTVLDPSESLGPPGQCVVLDEKQFMAWSEESPSVHQVSPLMAVKLFRRLHPQSTTRIILAAICTDRVRMRFSANHKERSDIVDAAARKILALI